MDHNEEVHRTPAASSVGMPLGLALDEVLLREVIEDTELLDRMLEQAKLGDGQSNLCVDDFTDVFGDYQFGDGSI